MKPFLTPTLLLGQNRKTWRVKGTWEGKKLLILQSSLYFCHQLFKVINTTDNTRVSYRDSAGFPNDISDKDFTTWSWDQNVQIQALHVSFISTHPSSLNPNNGLCKTTFIINENLFLIYKCNLI